MHTPFDSGTSIEPGALAKPASIPLSVPEIIGNEWNYIKECLDTNWVSSVGSFVDRFEEATARYSKAAHAVATVNGTAALHVALLVAGVQSDDEVLVSALSFVAPANAIRYIGAWPVFMDSEPSYWQMDPEKVTTFLETKCTWKSEALINNSTGRRVKAILPVHILGHPCDMDPIVAVAQKYGLSVVEDATESLGARYKGNMVGNLGDIGCFSFNGNKLITTGGGGMIVTNNQKSADRARYLTTQAKDDSVEYFHNEIGFNYRLPNVLAALGVAQMERVEEYVEKKRTIARKYREALGDLEGISLMKSQPQVDPTFWLNTILISPERTLAERKQTIQDLNDNGIGSRPLWHPIHSLPPYRDCQSYKIEHAIDLYQRAICIPSSTGLTNADQERSIEVIRRVIIG